MPSNISMPSVSSLTPAGRRHRSLRLSGPRRRAIVEGVSLWLAVVLFFAVQPVFAEAREAVDDAAGAGRFHFVDAAGGQQPATLLRTDYRVEVSGLIADTRLIQAFENTSQAWREGVYVFPLPENASVYSLKMTAGERVIIGEIKTREAARHDYQKARAEGRQAAKVDQQRPNLFTTRLANIPPGETVTVEMRYQQAVRYQSGEFELRLPTTLTPRYMPGQPISEASGPIDWQGGWAAPTSQVPDANAISPHTVLPHDVAADSHRARIELQLNAGLPIAAVTSPTHGLNSTWNGETVTVVPSSGDIVMDRDLVVRWSPVLGQAPSAAVFHERWQGEDYLLALLVPGLDARSVLPRELIFVIDTSGSMAGESIRQARASLLRGLDTLSSQDRFNVIQFNSRTSALYDKARTANVANLSQARRYVRGLNADGGTEMASALEAALRSRPLNGTGAGSEEQGSRVRQVVFITDGAVGNEAGLFRQIQRDLAASRLFTVGIGSAPNMHFMREAARFGRGTYTAISDLATMSKPLDDLFGKMQAPVLVDIETQWPGSGQAYPRRPGDLFRGEPMVQVLHGQAPEGELRVSGRLPDGSVWQQQLPLAKAAPASGLHRHWAKEKINRLMDANLSGVVSETRQAEVTELALAHQLITRYTSFIAVDQTPVRPADADVRTDHIPTLLPAGSTPGMLRYPQTATWSPLLMALGLIGLLPCLALILLRRRVFL
ncbi:marine proteobacterial sortase target protein [Marinobacter caseinilyticus]|uniref:marine proteobacterial sortase target protein n=1 Tax=Marinobacter caseinilyticus TaxID=2692195 RepID=UPI001F2F29AB|nr:marine proteobacterial sortase target protein [Marinobacter caseinilyticus]